MNPMATHGAFSWFSHRNSDDDKARQFYQQVLGWRIQDREMADGSRYGMVMIDDQPVAGFAPHGNGTGGWLCYITVRDVDQCIRSASDAGAEILQVPEDVPGVGRIAVIQDPFGAEIGLVTYESMQA